MELISKQAVIDVLKERQTFYAERNEGRQMFAIANAVDDILNIPSHTNWHIGTPIEDGEYFVAYHWGLDNKIMHDMAGRILYGATTFENGNWKIDYPYCVVAWQKIEPYKETD